MLKEVNNLSDDYVYSKDFVDYSRAYFENGNQTTVLAKDSDYDKVIGCATLSYIEVMPTFSHPTGKRVHLMNVYTDKNYRRKGIAYHMVDMLIKEAKEKGVTEISLDATNQGRPLYKKMGFTESEECMILTL
jgi:ribosomal protein S18 acetylase RimI-like enzyme